MAIVLARLLGIMVIILLAVLANWLVQRALENLAERLRQKAKPELAPRAATLVETGGSIARYTIIFFAAFMALMQAGINLTPILLGVGVAGLAIGFGAQSLVKDLVGGLFILVEGQFSVGDTVEINGVLGIVEEVGLRITRLRDPRGQIHFFPNGAITSLNRSPQQGPAYLLQIPAGEAQADKIRAVAERIFADFNREFEAFASGPVFVSAKSLSTQVVLLCYETRLSPLRLAASLEKLSSRLAAGLQRAGHALPEGTEISLLPMLPEKPQ